MDLVEKIRKSLVAGLTGVLYAYASATGFYIIADIPFHFWPKNAA